MTWTSLGSLAGRKNILFGFALNYKLISGNGDHDALVARECTIVTHENAMKWEGIHPERDRYTFTQADAIVDFAERHAMKVRAYLLLASRAAPVGQARCDEAQCRGGSGEHIATVAGRYKGRLHSWDVVNEAIQLKDNQPGGWKNSFWYTVPICALGIQSHLRAATGENFAPDLPIFIAKVRDLGLDIYITELDVDDSHLTTTGIARDAAVVEVYQRYLDLVLSTGSVSVAITWGAWDIVRPVGAEAVSGPSAQHPLLFAPGGDPTSAPAAAAQSLRRAPPRR